jgi:hypothetical protein
MVNDDQRFGRGGNEVEGAITGAIRKRFWEPQKCIYTLDYRRDLHMSFFRMIVAPAQFLNGGILKN